MTFISTENTVHHWRRGRRLLRVTLIGFLVVFIVWLVTGLVFLEGYFPLAPGLGTHFAPDYSEAAFDQIQIGDSKERVLELIGEPLERCDMGRTKDQFWCYSTDGGFLLLDFAWLYRAVYFDAEGRVIELVRDIFYD
jgi:hypothetical protein